MYHFTLTSFWMCMQTELCGEIRPNVRAVQVDLDKEKKEIHTWFYFDGEISDDDREIASYIIGQATNDADLNFRQEEQYLRLDYPQKIPTQGYYVYLRDESILPYGSVVTDLGKERKNPYIEAISYKFSYLELRLQNALLGRIRPNLRAVKADIDEWKKILYFWFYFDGSMAPQDMEIAQQVMQETKVYFGSEYTIKDSIGSLDYPASPPTMGMFIYKRDEKIFAPEEEEKEGWKCRFNTMRLLIGTQNALLGKITPNLRAVKVSIDQCTETCYSWFFYDKRIGEEEERLAKMGVDGYPSGYSHESFVERVDFPTPLPHVGRYAYLRYEPPTDTPQASESSFTMLQSHIAAYLNKGEGKIPSNLKAVKADIHEIDKILYFWFYFLREVTEENYSFARTIMCKTVAHFDSEYTIEESIQALHISQEVPDVGRLVYPDFKENEEEAYQLKDWGKRSRPLFSLLLRTRKALFGRVRSTLRAVKVTLNELEKRWYIWFYYDGEVQKEDYVLAQELIEQVSSELHYGVEEHLERLDYPHPIPHIGRYAYQRYE